MPYLPQSVPFPTPDGWVDEDFVYYFDSTTNTPALGVVLAPGATNYNIPLQLQSDAIFIIRSINVANPQQPLLIRFRDAFGHYLSDDLVPVNNYASFQPLAGSLPGIQGPVVELELLCPAGSQILVDLGNVG